MKAGRVCGAAGAQIVVGMASLGTATLCSSLCGGKAAGFWAGSRGEVVLWAE